MPDKKKPAPKRPAPLLKLKFEKFPNKLVPVFFEPQKREFDAHFGFERYAATSVAALEAKIKNAIKNGATPDVAWVPVIAIVNDFGTDWNTSSKCSAGMDFSIERCYIAITKNGLSEVEWSLPERARNLRAQPCSTGVGWAESRKLKSLPKLPRIGKSPYDGALIPYNESLWQKLQAIMGQLRATRKSFEEAIAKLNFDAVFIPKAAAQPKPSAPKSTKSTKSTKKPKPVKVSWPIIEHAGRVFTLSSGPLPLPLINGIAAAMPSVTKAHALKDGRIQLILRSTSVPMYITAQKLQEMLAQEKLGFPEREPEPAGVDA